MREGVTQAHRFRGTAEGPQSLAHLKATGEILQAITASPGDVQPVFDAIIRNAVKLGAATFGLLVRCDGQTVEIGSPYNLTPEVQALFHKAFPMPVSRDNPTGQAILERRVVNAADVHVEPYSEGAKQRARAIGYRGILSVPLLRNSDAIGALTIARPEPVAFSETEVALLRTFADQAVIAIENARLVAALRREIEAHGRTKATVDRLSEDMRGAIIGESALMREMLAQVAQVARTDSTVLIQGETGTGKELVARAIHEQSARCDRPLVKVNCAALPRELVESELFGHEKGAFTGATQQRRGRFELADGGTLFLDEVGDLPLEAQAKLLRVLQEREFERLGGAQSLRVDVRLIAATNRDLGSRVAGGEFRSDLYYRLNVFPISVPPLRERRDDISRLLAHFANKVARKLGRTCDGVSPALVERASAYHWPGNVRELENLVERAMIVSGGGTLDDSPVFHFAPVPAHADAAGDRAAATSLQDVERAHILRILAATHGVIEGESGAARSLGLKPSTLRARLRKLAIPRGH